MNNKMISSFSRTIGRKLSNNQRIALKDYSEKFLINEEAEFETIFNSNKKISVEIGFGSGEHIIHLAEANKENLFIGCEPFLNGVANLLKQIGLNKIDNIRIWKNDARIIINQSPNNKLDKIYILFPDPWPKVKHHKRRIISTETLELLHSKLKIGGEIIIATDHSEYAKSIKNIIINHKKFNLTNDDLHLQPTSWVKTRYQLKAEAQNLSIYFFVLTKSS